LNRPAGRSRFVALAGVTAGPTARATFVSLIDQAIVSGTSFATTIVVGRAGGEAELGVYALAFSIVLLAITLQDSLVSVPYTVFGNRLATPERAKLAGSVLVHHAVLAAAAGLVFLVGWAALAVLGPARYAPVALALSLMAPLWLLREFERQLAFAWLAVGTVLALDIVVALLQLGGLAVAAIGGRLSAPHALGIVGLASGLGGAVWLLRARRRVVVRLRDARDDLARHWAFGRWVAADQATTILQGYGVHWVLAFTLGIAATGRFAAGLTIVLVANPIILGLVNVLGPRAATAWAEGGADELRRVVFKATAFLALVLVVLWAVLIVFGGRIVTLVYGAEYEGLGGTVGVLATAMLVWGADVTAANGLRAMGRPEPNLHSSLVALVVTLVAAGFLGATSGLLGGAIGLLAGSAVRAAWRWAAFLRLSGR
jgi:O-antigen/teichoic acid export membrane protein